MHGVDHGFGGVKYGKLNGSFGSPLGKGGIDEFDLGFLNKDIGGAFGGSFGGYGVAGGIDRSYGSHGHGHGHKGHGGYGHGHHGHGAGYGKNTVAVHDSFRVNDVYGGHGGKGGHGMRFLIDNRMNDFAGKGAGIWKGTASKLAGYSGFGTSFGIGGLHSAGYGHGYDAGYGHAGHGHGHGHHGHGYAGHTGHGAGYGQAFGNYNLW